MSAPGSPTSERDGGAADEAALLRFANKLADYSAEVVLRHFRTPLAIEDKADGSASGYSPATIADREAEAVMRRMIAEAFPHHGVLGEELGHVNPGAHITWTLDPIDGTKSYIAGIPLWGTLIALAYDGTPKIGIMNQPHTRERFVGSSMGSYLGACKLQTRPCAVLGHATLYATEIEMFRGKAERRAFESISARARMTRFGADCYAYCMLACGLIDLVIEAHLNPWDIQALIPIIEGAGGVVTTWSGDPVAAGGNVVAAGDRRLHAEVLPMLRAAIPSD